LDVGYGSDTSSAIGLAGSDIAAIDPSSLDTFTMRPAGARRSSGRNALVTTTTPNTLVSYTVRMASSGV
jgi:hypothetical protein